MKTTRRPARPTIAAIAIAIGLGCFLLASTLEAQHRAGRQAHRSVTGHRSAQTQAEDLRQRNRHLASPLGLGSAANAGPGFYQRLNVPPGPHPGAIPVPVYVPYAVFIEPPAFAASPQQVAAPPQQDAYPPPTPAPAPPPQIYVIQQPPPEVAPLTPPPPAAPRPPAPPKSRDPAPVSFAVAPADASVYLDDDYLGNGEALAQEAMLLRPGVHVLEVTHPDMRAQRLVFGVSSEEPLEVLIDLAAERAGQRSRIR